MHPQNFPTQKSSSSSPQRPPSGTVHPAQSTGGSSPSAGGGHSGGTTENLIKTPLLKVVEVSSAAERGSSSLAVAVGVGEGGSGSGVEKPVVQIGVEDPSWGAKQSNKRKAQSGVPNCPLCQKKFASWEDAYASLLAHLRDPFKPPVLFSTSSPPEPAPAPAPAPAPEAVQVQGDSGSREGGSLSSAARPRGITFDLNQPMEGGKSNAAENADGGKKFEFDLNERPVEDEENKP